MMSAFRAESASWYAGLQVAAGAYVRDLNAPAVWAGLTTFLWYAVGIVPVQIAIIGQFGLAAPQVSSWIFIIWFTGAISSMGLSLVYRQPIPITSSIPALIFMGTLVGHYTFAELVGANLLAGVLITGLGVLGIGERILVWLPMPLAMGMLAGSILGEVTRVVSATIDDVLVAGATVAGYVVGRSLRNPRVPPVAVALATGGLAVLVGHTATPGPIEFSLPSLVMPEMQFSFAAVVAVSLPLVVLSMGLGNVQGLGFLVAQGYRVPANQVTLVLGVNSIVNALFGGHSAIVSRNGMPIMASPEAGPLGGRYWANIISAALTLLIAVAAVPVTALLGILPHAYIVAVAGLAILPSLQSALEKAFASTLRFGGVVAFVVAATAPFSVLGITSAFWALLAGVAVSFLTEREELLAHWRGDDSAAAQRRESPSLPREIFQSWAHDVTGPLPTAVTATICELRPDGLLVRSDSQLTAGRQLEFGFQLPDGGEEIILRVKVQNVEHLQSKLPDVWEAGCEFHDTEPLAREQIIPFVHVQRQAPKKAA